MEGVCVCVCQLSSRARSATRKHLRKNEILSSSFLFPSHITSSQSPIVWVAINPPSQAVSDMEQLALAYIQMFSITVVAPEVLEHLSLSKRRKILSLVHQELRSVQDSCQNIIDSEVVSASGTQIAAAWDQGLNEYMRTVESVIKNDPKRKTFDKVNVQPSTNLTPRVHGRF